MDWRGADLPGGVYCRTHAAPHHGAAIVLTGFIFYFLIVVPGTGGEICMSRTMKTVGEVTDFRPQSIARVIGRAMRVPWFWIGITMMATGFFALLGMLAVANVSFVFPATAISYAVGTLGGKL